jgi:putative tricarboxylic transport membrane protein
VNLPVALDEHGGNTSLPTGRQAKPCKAVFSHFGGIAMGVANLIAGIAVLLLGSVVAFFAGRLPYKAEYGPGPGFMPLWIGVALIVCATATIIKTVRQYGHEEGRFIQPKTRQVVFVLVTLIITFLLVPVFGLSLGLALFTGFTMRTAGRHGWVLCVLVAVATAAAVRFIFGYGLDIPLPKGFIGL